MDNILIKKIIKENINSLLTEVMNLEDVYQKWYSDIDEEIFNKIVSADPTSNQNKIGKYSKWLLNLYKTNKLKLEDLYKATEYLNYFIKFNNKINDKDINHYKSLPELYNSIKDFIENPEQATSNSDEVRKIKNAEAKKVYEDNEWIVIIPLTHRAACYYGKGTQWCTASKDDDYYFSHYNSKGILYININKKTGSKFQFHFESKQFMDEIDNSIFENIDEDNINLYKNKSALEMLLGFNQGIMNFYREIYMNNTSYLPIFYFYSLNYIFENFKTLINTFGIRKLVEDYTSYIDDDKILYKIKINYGCYNFVTKDYKILSNIWFNNADDFNINGKYAKVQNNEELNNFIDRDGNFLFDEFKITTDFDEEGFVVISEDDVKYYMNENGENPFNEYFKYATPFDNGYAIVTFDFDDGWFIMDKNGTFFNKEPFDKCQELRCGYFLIEKNNLFNFLSIDGNYLLDKWINYTTNFKSDFEIATIKYHNKYNFITTNGSFILKDWVDFAKDFTNIGYSVVYKNKKSNIINYKGEYILDEWSDEEIKLFDFTQPVARFFELNKKPDLTGTINQSFYFLKKEIKLPKLSVPLDENYNNTKKNNMKKQVIKLTESDLHRVIKESVKKVLSEQTNSFEYDVYENKINDVVRENLMDKIKEKYKEKQRKKDRERCKQAGEGDGKDYL